MADTTQHEHVQPVLAVAVRDIEIDSALVLSIHRKPQRGLSQRLRHVFGLPEQAMPHTLAQKVHLPIEGLQFDTSLCCIRA